MRTFKYSDGSGKVVDAPCGFQSSDYDGRRRYEVVCKGVIEISLSQSVKVLRLLGATSIPVCAIYSIPEAQRRLGRFQTPSHICARQLSAFIYFALLITTALCRHRTRPPATQLDGTA